LIALIISPFPLESPALPLLKAGRLTWSAIDGRFARADFSVHHRPALTDSFIPGGETRDGKSGRGA